jgi:hypothetical protein
MVFDHRQNSNYLLFVLVSTVATLTTTFCVCEEEQKNLQSTMVSTRRSRQKTPPAGVPTRHMRYLSRQELQRTHIEQGEQGEGRPQESVPAVGAGKEKERLFLGSDSSTTTDGEEAAATLPQPLVASAATAADAAAVDFVNDGNIFAAGVEESQEDEVEEDVFFESHEDEVEEEPGGGYPPGDIIEQEGVVEEQGGEYPPGDIIESQDDEVEEDQGGEDPPGDIILNRKGRLALDDAELYTYFVNRLLGMICPNKNCDCLAILQSGNVQSSVAMYLSWFERRSQYEQNSIVFEWWRYVLILRPSKKQRKGKRNKTLFRLPYFVGDGNDDDSNEHRSHLVCVRGLNTLLNIGQKRYIKIRNAAVSSAVLPKHKRIGTVAAHAVKKNERKYLPLVNHFEYLKNLGEVRATRVVATLVDGMGGHVNRDDDINVIYLPISMGYRSCYKRYMKSIGYNIQTTALGGFIVTSDEEGKEVDPSDFVTFPTYFNMWKKDYKDLKVSRPVEDICKDCYVFANRHRHLANHAMRQDIQNDFGDDDDDNGNNNDDDDDNDGDSTDDSDEDDDGNFVAKNVEEREEMLIEAAEHVKMARTQRMLYQQKVDDAVQDAKVGRPHNERRYTFVVDYGQNMELPMFNKEQPGVTYYYSPLSIYNLGMVNHAHVYDDGRVTEHLHVHVYHEGIGKKGANNVSSLIMKTLSDLNLLRDEEVGGELNIIFDNCSGQNKNNTVLRLAPWITELGYFKSVNFIFLVVGHTKNAADRLFNVLKKEYQRSNIFTFADLVTKLNTSTSVTVHQPTSVDFLDYDKLFDGIYRKLTGQIKKNHIFYCEFDDVMKLRQSNLSEHAEYCVCLRKKNWKDVGREEMLAYAEKMLRPIKCDGLNPYKMVEMWKNYRPVIPVEYQSDVLYVKPSPEVLAKVKVEKTDRSEFRANLKAKKYEKKERVESTAFDGDEKERLESTEFDGDDGEKGMA